MTKIKFIKGTIKQLIEWGKEEDDMDDKTEKEMSEKEEFKKDLAKLHKIFELPWRELGKWYSGHFDPTGCSFLLGEPIKLGKLNALPGMDITQKELDRAWRAYCFLIKEEGTGEKQDGEMAKFEVSAGEGG